MGCLGDCWEIGPPPDSILFLPPPPVPAFLQNSLPDLLVSNTTCVSPQLCEAWRETVGDGVAGAGEDFIELPRKDVESWSVSNIDDTWLLVLVASSIGVLLLGALLAMFLLKCREMNMFGNNECSMHGSRNDRQMKNHQQHHHPDRDRECSSVSNLNGGGGSGNSKLIHPADSVLYHGSASVHPDNRMVWAALTPRGTQHFISENYPADHLMGGAGDYVETDDHYETIDNLQIQPVYAYSTYQKDYEYEDPTPLIESYQMNDMIDGGGGGGVGGHQLQQHHQHNPHHHHQQYSMIGNTDMRCAATFGGGGSMRRAAAAGAVPIATTYRPRVSSPTRIEHPNLPPLNLYPHQGTLTKSSTVAAAAAASYHHPNHHSNSHHQHHHHHHSNSTLGGYRNGGGGGGADTLPKYAC